MEKKIKGIYGKDIETINGNKTYLTCITNTGERFSIGFKQLFKLFDDYEFILEQHGENFRTIDFVQYPKDDEELSPLIYIKKFN